LVLGLVTVIGCNQGTPGGPGATGSPPSTVTTQKPALGPSDETFNLSVPVLATQVKQGESKVASISVSRGKNFDEDVTLSFGQLPQGVTIEPAKPVIMHGETEAKITFQAADDAAIGSFTVGVTGHPTRGADAKTNLNLSVAGK
jgi:hypothetical protein